MTRRSLFVFAHQDDELAAAAYILEALRAGAEVFCVYLSDGAGMGCDPAVRDSESRRALQALGVLPERIHFIGSTLRIPDGALVEYLDRADAALESELGAIAFDEFFCLAFEGGHQDHDASHLVTLAFAARRGLLDRCWAVPLYRGLGSLPAYRVFAPLRDHAANTTTVRFRDAMRIVSMFRAYPSQRPSIYAFLPEAIIRLLVLRRTARYRVDSARVRERPHTGRLFYEWRYKFPYERFEAAARPFIDRHLPR